MNLLTVVLFLPLAGFLIALLIPRSLAQGSRMWALVISLGHLRRLARPAGLVRPQHRGRAVR